MPFTLEILTIGLLVFLFCVFVLGKDDFLLLRKNVSLEELFNMTILGGIISIFVSRLGFVLGHPRPMYFNPLIFLAMPYFPGLSLAFAIMGFFLYVFFYATKKKFPAKRIFDLMITSFTGSLSIGSLLFFIASFFVNKKTEFIFFVEFFLYAFWFWFLVWLFAKSKTRDGDTSIIGMIFICLTQIVFLAYMRGVKSLFQFGLDDRVFLIEVVFLILMFVQVSHKKKS